jgi:hypothetical protein
MDKLADELATLGTAKPSTTAAVIKPPPESGLQAKISRLAANNLARISGV